jgi:hypothetical protein
MHLAGCKSPRSKDGRESPFSSSPMRIAPKVGAARHSHCITAFTTGQAFGREYAPVARDNIGQMANMEFRQMANASLRFLWYTEID